MLIHVVVPVPDTQGPSIYRHNELPAGPARQTDGPLLPAVVAFNVPASHSFTTLYYSTGPKKEESFGHSTDGILPISIPHDMGHS